MSAYGSVKRRPYVNHFLGNYVFRKTQRLKIKGPHLAGLYFFIVFVASSQSALPGRLDLELNRLAELFDCPRLFLYRLAEYVRPHVSRGTATLPLAPGRLYELTARLGHFITPISNTD